MELIEKKTCLCIAYMGNLLKKGEKYLCEFYFLSKDLETIDIKWDSESKIRNVAKITVYDNTINGHIEIKFYFKSEFDKFDKEDLYENAWPFEDFLIRMDDYREQQINKIDI